MKAPCLDLAAGQQAGGDKLDPSFSAYIDMGACRPIPFVETEPVQLPKKFDQIFFATFTTLIRIIKYRLIIKLIIRMNRKSRDESIKPN